MAKVSRRTVLASVPAAGLALTAPAAAEGQSKLMQLFREWEALYRAASDLTFDEEIACGAFDRMRLLEQEINKLPPTTAEEFAARLVIETAYGDISLDDAGSGGVIDAAVALLETGRLQQAV